MKNRTFHVTISLVVLVMFVATLFAFAQAPASSPAKTSCPGCKTIKAPADKTAPAKACPGCKDKAGCGNCCVYDKNLKKVVCTCCSVDKKTGKVVCNSKDPNAKKCCTTVDPKTGKTCCTVDKASGKVVCSCCTYDAKTGKVTCTKGAGCKDGKCGSGCKGGKCGDSKKTTSASPAPKAGHNCSGCKTEKK